MKLKIAILLIICLTASLASAITGGGRMSGVFASYKVPKPPKEPSVTATAGNAQNSVSWSAGATDGTHDAPTSYTLYGGTSASPTTSIYSGSATSYTHTGLTNGTPYYYRATATNTDGTSGYSSPDATATPDVAYIARAEFNGASVDTGFTAGTASGGTVAVTGGYAQLRGTVDADAAMIAYNAALPSISSAWTVRVKGKYYGSAVTNMDFLRITQQATAPTPTASNDTVVGVNGRVDIIVRPSAGYIIQYRDTTDYYPRWTAGSSNWNTATGFTSGVLSASTDYVFRMENNTSSQFRISIFSATDTSEASPLVQTSWTSWSLVKSGTGSYWLYAGDLNTQWDFVNMDIDYIRVQ